MSKLYPKPVLTSEDNSSYKENIDFQLNIINNKVDTEKIELEVKIDMNSNVINELIDDLKADFGIKVMTNLSTKFTYFDFNGDTYKIEIPTEMLERKDKVRLVGYILASEAFDYPWNDELIDIYDQSYVFSYNAKELLAESNEDSLDFTSAADPFISVSKAKEQEGEGLLFSIEHENVIKVKVGPTFSEAYSKLQPENRKACCKDILNSFIAQETIQYALLKLSLSKEELGVYKSRDWYNALELCFNVDSYESLDDFILAMRIDIDLDLIVKVSQQMLNNQVEAKVIDTWRKAQ